MILASVIPSFNRYIFLTTKQTLILADDSFFSPYNWLNIYTCLFEFKSVFCAFDCLVLSAHFRSLTVFYLLDWEVVFVLTAGS